MEAQMNPQSLSPQRLSPQRLSPQRLSLQGRRQLLEQRFPVWTPMTLDTRLSACVEQFGEEPFVISDAGTLTYADVAEQVTRLADGLARLGVAPGDTVGILMANYAEFVTVKFAVARAGAVAVPFNYLYRAAELGYVLEQSGCSVLLTMTGFGDLDYLAILDQVAPGWETGASPALPALRHVVLLPTDGRVRDGVLTVEDLGRLGTEHPGSALTGQRRPEDIGDMLYTSGTTGSPKGVLVSHDAVLRDAFASAYTRGFEPGRRILFSLPCYHMFGYVEGLLAAMMVGGSVVLRTAFDPADYLASIERHRATDVLAVPTMTVALLECPDHLTRDLSSLTAMLSGAAPAPVWLWERVVTELGVTEIVTGYGMTECGGALTLTWPDDALERHASTVGRPKVAWVAGIPDRGGAIAEYRAVDPDTGVTLPAGAEGELASRGPTSMAGYWNKPAETAAVLRDGWIYSGDLGRVRADGYLEVTGRTKELYKSGGELVMPKEIEELLTGQDGISQVYAIGVPDERWGEIGVVCVVRSPGSQVGEAQILDLCRLKLARFKVPKRVLFIAAGDLPTTPTGKVQKFRLVKMAGQQLAGELA